jgi:hypothetical protein
VTRPTYARELRAIQKRRARRKKLAAAVRTPGYMRVPLNYAGVTLEKGGPHIMNVLKSRKFWASVAGLMLVVIQQFVPDFPLDNAQMTNVILVIVAYVIGTGLEDSAPTS